MSIKASNVDMASPPFGWIEQTNTTFGAKPNRPYACAYRIIAHFGNKSMIIVLRK